MSNANQMLCGYKDDPRQWDQPEDEAEESPLTITEQRIEWLCDDWKLAIEEDTYEAWNDMRLTIYGAVQMINDVPGWHQERDDLNTLSRMAFENSIEAIAAGNYQEAA